MARPPASLPPTSTSPLKVSLLLGSFVHSPAKYELFDLYLPESQPAPQHPDEASFHPLPPIAHTFRPEQRIPAKAVSAFFAAFVFWPWFVLVGLVCSPLPSMVTAVMLISEKWAQIRPRIPHIFSPYILPFIVTLGAFEALLLWYWIDLKLGQVLLYGGILGVFTALAGNQALSKSGQWRMGKK